MALEGLVNEQATYLLESFQKLDPDTIQHSDEITKDRIKDEDLRYKWFYTADHILYRVEYGEVVLYLGRRETNPIFKNLKEATQQLSQLSYNIKKGNYLLKKEDIEAVVNAESTLRIKVSDLELEEHRFGIFDYFGINYPHAKLNDAQRTFAERVYGQGEDFEKAMEMFKKAGINNTRIYVLSPGYIKKDNAKKESVIMRAYWIGSFVENSNFDAEEWDVEDPNLWWRGVRLFAEGGAPEKTYTLNQ